jgi:ribonuclease M5
MFKEVIVVEGRDDTRRLREIYPDIETIETNGSAINERTLNQIKKLQETRGVIVFTDPDFPGNKIRNTIMQAIPDCKHAYIKKVDAIAKGDRGVGVEHASEAVIKEALANLVTPTHEVSEFIEMDFLINLNLIGHSNSSKIREQLAQRLGIGYVNGKQLQKRLHMFGITKEQIKIALEKGQSSFTRQSD